MVSANFSCSCARRKKSELHVSVSPYMSTILAFGRSFRSRAPEKIVRGMEATLADQKLELQKLRARLSQLDRPEHLSLRRIYINVFRGDVEIAFLVGP